MSLDNKRPCVVLISRIWVFTEVEEIDSNSDTPENRVFVSGNYTVRNQEMIKEGDLENEEDNQVENSSRTGKQFR